MWFFEAKGFWNSNVIMCSYASSGWCDDIVMMFLEDVPFVLVSLPCLWISPRHLRCFPYRGRRMCLLWFCLGLCLQCSSLRVLESAHHNSIFQSSVPNCLFCSKRAKKQQKPCSFCIFPSIHLLLEAFEDTTSWSTEGVALATSSQVAALSGVCGGPGIVLKARKALKKKPMRLSKIWVTRRFLEWPSKLRNSSGTWCAATHLSLFSAVNSSEKWLMGRCYDFLAFF